MGAYPSGANGFARVNPRSPRAFGICDRCGFRWNRNDLIWQLDWRGSQLQNLRILVCRRCLDVPQEQLRSYSPPPDPIPIRDPRPDLSNEGNAPIGVYTVAGTISLPLLDDLGNVITDDLGNPILVAEPLSQTLIGASATRSILNFTLPSSFGLWLNPTGGSALPGAPGAVFYAPGSYYEAFGAASQPAMTYYTTIAGLLIVVQSQ